jgi:hypothetical protein
MMRCGGQRTCAHEHKQVIEASIYFTKALCMGLAKLALAKVQLAC